MWKWYKKNTPCWMIHDWVCLVETNTSLEFLLRLAGKPTARCSKCGKTNELEDEWE